MSAFNPENVHQHDDGRWYHDGRDCTDDRILWRCAAGHEWVDTIGNRTGPDDKGCPTCALERLTGG